MANVERKVWGGIRGLLLAALIGLGVGFGATPAAAQQVVVVGNQRIEAETVRSYLNLRPGVPFDAARQDDAVKALFATGLFRDVTISRDGGRIVVRVVENPVINQVRFEGNRRVEASALRNEVESRARGIYTEARVRSDVQRINDLYRRQGRFDARVEPQVVELPQNRVDIVFRVTEGERTQIRSITFVGNRAFGTGRLRDVITTKETNFLSWLSPRDVYDPDRLSVDQELLRRHYLRNGYADFRVVSAAADFNAQANAFTITITIDEGEQYRFGTIEVESNVAAVDAASLRSFVRASSGAVYNAELIDRTLEEMSLEIARRGYPFAQVRPRGERDAANRVVNLAFVVDEAPRVYVERINVRGNTRTMDSVIRREFEIAEGDALNRVLVDRAERRLNQLNYFQTVRITREPGSAPDRVVLNVGVEEKSTGEVSFGAGYASNEGFIADISITERNFLGRGQFVRAAIGWGQTRRNLDVSFTEPYFLDRRLAAGVDFFYRRNMATRFQSFDQEIIGGGVRLGLMIDDNLSAQVRYRLFEQRINVRPNFRDCPSFPVGALIDTGDQTAFPGSVAGNGIHDCLDNGEVSFALRQAQGRALVSAAGFSLVLNRLDQPRNPRSGIYADLNVDVAGLGGDVYYARATTEARAYYNFWEDLVGMVRIRAGHIAGWNGRGNRLVDNFFQGGETIRGFQTAGYGPRDVSINFRQDALGGSTYVNATAELQFPIPFLPDELGLRAALFADAGTLFGLPRSNLEAAGYVRCTGSNAATCNYFDDPWSIRSSVGVSLLWQSPLGPLRFDFAHPLSRETYDRTQFFRFSGGTTF